MTVASTLERTCALFCIENTLDMFQSHFADLVTAVDFSRQTVTKLERIFLDYLILHSLARVIMEVDERCRPSLLCKD